MTSDNPLLRSLRTHIAYMAPQQAERRAGKMIIQAAAEIERLLAVERENAAMRKLIAESSLDCVYCGLSKYDMAKCACGFPGCGRADDMMHEAKQ